MSTFADITCHRRLTCGIDLVMQPLPGRPVAAMEIRLPAGFAFERTEYLGVAHVLNEAVTKGTAKRDARGVNDAFDAIGASHDSYAGRETVGFASLCLPEFVEQVITLYAEILRTPTFPEEACAVAVDLARQSLAALRDDPDELVRKLICRQAYGEPLGRHALGDEESLGRIGREQIVEHWRRLFSSRRMQVAVAGAVDTERVADLFEREFTGFGPVEGEGEAASPSLRFNPGRSHHHKELEQEHVAICFPGSAVTDADFPVELVLIGVLSGGMSGRLFTEVREKQGLVYWVGAWSDHPRTGGMLHVGASTTPDRVDQTYATLLREINRLSEDLTEEEVQRAITGLVAQVRTRGDVTRSRASRLADDLFFHGCPIPITEKLARIQAVTVSDIRGFLARHPRDRLSVVTLGPRELAR
ncbi:MAG TPA: pitrilysin family protein [Phycisphaerae bacterium]|nr:pitrilysin family protein [Phycisphaerae bacterium]HRY68230.1 pitrilysin family protein [Phycisphaerae bacterium]HSA28586.1 pitrilysin family protein [Phycisphaerae bacterium]